MGSLAPLASRVLPGCARHADEIRPALLDIKEQSTGLFAVTWKVPTRNGQALAIAPKLPASLERVGSPSEQDVAGARVIHATYKNNSDSLTGQTIVIEGLSTVQTDVLLLVQLQNGNQHSAISATGFPRVHDSAGGIEAQDRGRLLAHGHDSHPRRGGSSLVRAGAALDRRGSRPALEGGHRVHRRAQHHAWRWRHWV